MSSPSSVSTSIQDIAPRPSLARRLADRIAPPPAVGRLILSLPSGETIERRGSAPGVEAEIVIERWRAAWRLMREGDLGFSRAYIDGDWTTPDLLSVLEFCHRNEAALSGAWQGGWLARLLNGLQHRLHDNTRRGSRRNIAAHYDLGNAFYETWLDRGMHYSSALYRDGNETLEDAQEIKLDRISELLDLEGNEGVLEIGCGWGALAERLVRRHGCAVTGLTLSTEQLAYAKARLARHGDAADLRLMDYRAVEGRFDRIVSIEMLEAVGERYWPVYFDKLRACLAPGGTAVLQVITIDESRFPDYRARPDFIQRYIFPGGMLPTRQAIAREAERAGLALVSSEMFGQSYARTIAEWRGRFEAAWPAVQALGFDARFKRMWDYYLAYCEVGFALGSVDVGFYKFVPRPG